MASPAGPSISRETLVSPPLLRSQTWPQTEEQEEQWLLGKQAEWLLEDEQGQDGQEELGELYVGKRQQHRTQETRTQGGEQRQEAHTDDERKPEPQQQQRQAGPLQEAEKAQHWQQRPQAQEEQRNFRPQPQQLLTLERALHVGRQPDVSAEKAANMEPLTRNTVPASAAGTLDSNSAANSSSPAAATLHVTENACEATSLHASSALQPHSTSTANIVSAPEHQVAAAVAREDAREADAAAGPSAAGRGVSSSQGTEERADDTLNTPSAATASAEAPPRVPPANGSRRTGHTHSEQAAPGCRGSSPTPCARAGDPRTGNSGGSNTDPVGSRGLGSSYSGTEDSSSGANSGSGGEKSSRESEEGKGSGAGQRNDSQGGGSTSRSAESSGSMSNSSGDGRSGKGTDRSSNEEDGEGSSSGRSADDYVVHSMDENTITFTYKGFLFSSVTRRKRRVPREGVLAGKSDARHVTCAAASDERVRRSSTGVQEASVVAVDCSAEPLEVENRSAAAEPPSAGTAAKPARAVPTAIAVAEGGARFAPCDISPTTAEKTPASSPRPPAVAAALHGDAAASLVGGVSVGGGAAAAGGVAGSRATAGPAAAGRAPADVVAPGVDGDARVALPPPLWYVPPRGRHYCCYVSQKAAAAAAAAASANERYAAVKQEQQQQQQRHVNKAQEPHSTAQAAEQTAAAALTAQEEIKLTSLTPACCPHVCADCATHAAAAVAAASAPCATAAPAAAPAAPSDAFPVSGTPAAACVACAVGETPKGRCPLRSSAVFPGGKTGADPAAADVPSLGEGLLAQGGAMKNRSAVAEDGSVQGESPVAGVSHRRPTSLAPAAASPQEKTPEAAAAAAVATPLILDIPLVQAELPCLSSPGGSSSSSWTSSSYYSNQTSGSVAQSAATSSSSSSLDTTGKSDSSSGTPGVAGVTTVGGSGPAGERRSSGSSREGHEETGLRDMDGGSLLAQQPCFPCERSEKTSSSASSSDGTRPVGSVAAADVAAAQLLTAASQTRDSTAAAAAGGGRGRGGGGGARDPSPDEQKAAAAKEQQHVVAGVLQKTAQSCSSVRPDPGAEAAQAVATRAGAAASAAPAAVATASVPAEEAAAAEEKNRWTMPAVEAFMLQLRRGELRGSHQAARRTAEVLRQVVDQHPWKTTQELVDVVKQLGRSFLRADPMEFLVSNVVRRILCIIRTEHCKQLRKRQPQEDDEEDEERCSDQLLQGLGSGGSTGAHGDMTRLPLLRLDRFRTSPLRSAGMHAFSFSSFASRSADDPQQLSLPVPATVKHSIFEGISELVAEVDTAWEEGEDVRTACFSNGDCILTYGYSLAVERLLKALHRKNQGEGATHSSRKKKKKGRVRCSFQVLVLGGDTEQGGKKMAERLVAAGIKTAYVADAALLTVIHKVDKVLLGTRAILSSGGAVALSGARYVAEAAKIYNRPVMVVAPLFKLTHLPLYDQHSRNQLLSPSAVLPDLPELRNVSVRIPKYDYIPDTLLAVFITEIGPVDPSCLFFLAQQRYDVEDLDLYAVV